MTPDDSQQELEKCLAQAGAPLTALTPAEGIPLMLDFYRRTRAEGCPLEEDGDMLLYQWGTYDGDEGRHFQLDLTRQFIQADAEDEAIHQLSLTFVFPPSPAFEAVKAGNRWCQSPDELEAFAAFITTSGAYQAAATARPEAVRLQYGGV